MAPPQSVLSAGIVKRVIARLDLRLGEMANPPVFVRKGYEAAMCLTSTWEPVRKEAFFTVACLPELATDMDRVLLRSSAPEEIEDEVRFQKLIAELTRTLQVSKTQFACASWLVCLCFCVLCRSFIMWSRGARCAEKAVE